MLRKDKRWVYGGPPVGNANFAWVQHFIHHLAPRGMAGFVLANGSMSSNQSGEGEIRKAIVEANLVDCMVALPGQLFYATQIPVCLWFLARDKKNGRFRDRCGQTLFIDARQFGTLIEELIALAKDMRAASARGEQLGLSEDELAFYDAIETDAIETNDSAVKLHCARTYARRSAFSSGGSCANTVTRPTSRRRRRRRCSNRPSFCRQRGPPPEPTNERLHK